MSNMESEKYDYYMHLHIFVTFQKKWRGLIGLFINLSVTRLGPAREGDRGKYLQAKNHCDWCQEPEGVAPPFRYCLLYSCSQKSPRNATFSSMTVGLSKVFAGAGVSKMGLIFDRPETFLITLPLGCFNQGLGVAMELNEKSRARKLSR